MLDRIHACLIVEKVTIPVQSGMILERMRGTRDGLGIREGSHCGRTTNRAWCHELNWHIGCIGHPCK